MCVKGAKLLKSSSILILALWTLAFLSILAVFSAPMVRQEINIFLRMREREELYGIAYSGIQKAIAFIGHYDSGDSTPNISSFDEDWVEFPSAFRNIEFNKGRFSVFCHRINNITGKKEKRYGLLDEESKINVNHVSYAVLKRLFKDIAGLDSQKANDLANSLIDWRDKNSELNGQDTQLTERASYLNAGYSYSPKNMELNSIEEVLLIKGMPAPVFFKIADYITVYGNGEVNINTAPAPVLECLGFTQQAAEKIVSYRAGHDMKEGTIDDNVFSSPGNMAEELSGYTELSDEEKDRISQISSQVKIGVKSEFFTAVSVSRLEKKNLYGKIKCVFSRSGSIKDWAFLYSNQP